MNWIYGWSADQWTAFGTVTFAIAAVCTAVWAIFNYRRAKRVEAAHWLQNTFEQFYLSEQFREVRHVLEYEYTDVLGPLLERRLTNRDVPCSAVELQVLQNIDNLLNYFEWMLYLQSNGHMSKDDLEALFDYWFGVMRDPNRSAVRRYCACWGWERLSNALNAQRLEYTASYGSLMTGLQLDDAPDMTDYLELVGPCTIKGTLYDLGHYPGLVSGDGNVAGELYRFKFELPDPRATEAFRLLDSYERYDAHDLSESLYRRHVVRLAQPDVDAWTYVYNHPVEEKLLIESGDWRDYSH